MRKSTSVNVNILGVKMLKVKIVEESLKVEKGKVIKVNIH